MLIGDLKTSQADADFNLTVENSAEVCSGDVLHEPIVARSCATFNGDKYLVRRPQPEDD